MTIVLVAAAGAALALFIWAAVDNRTNPNGWTTENRITLCSVLTALLVGAVSPWVAFLNQQRTNEYAERSWGAQARIKQREWQFEDFRFRRQIILESLSEFIGLLDQGTAWQWTPDWEKQERIQRDLEAAFRSLRLLASRIDLIADENNSHYDDLTQLFGRACHTIYKQMMSVFRQAQANYKLSTPERTEQARTVDLANAEQKVRDLQGSRDDRAKRLANQQVHVIDDNYDLYIQNIIERNGREEEENHQELMQIAGQLCEVGNAYLKEEQSNALEQVQLIEPPGDGP